MNGLMNCINESENHTKIRMSILSDKNVSGVNIFFIFFLTAANANLNIYSDPLKGNINCKN